MYRISFRDGQAGHMVATQAEFEAILETLTPSDNIMLEKWNHPLTPTVMESLPWPTYLDRWEQWAVALESGNYDQAGSVLATTDRKQNGAIGKSYCCLGVACDITKIGSWQWDERTKQFYFVVGESQSLLLPPGEVDAWFGVYMTEATYKMLDWTHTTTDKDAGGYNIVAAMSLLSRKAYQLRDESEYECDDLPFFATLNDSFECSFTEIAEVVREVMVHPKVNAYLNRPISCEKPFLELDVSDLPV